MILWAFAAAVALSIQTDSDGLKDTARLTWRYFQECRDPATNLVWDHASEDGGEKGEYTTPTNIAFDIAAAIAADDLGLIEQPRAIKHITGVLNTLERLEKDRGFLFNSYKTATALPADTFVSFVDNGWLSFALIAARQAYRKDLGDRCTALLAAQNYGVFYDSGAGLMRHGYHIPSRGITYGHYSMFCSEPRGPSLLAICKGDVPREHWFRMERARYAPGKGYHSGETRRYGGVDVREGYFVYEGISIVPSWGGSMFEFLMPSLFIDEMSHASRSLGENSARAVDAQIEYAKRQSLPVWGMSPSAKPSGGYGEFGVPAIGVQGYPATAVTPHASFLALSVRPARALENLCVLRERYGMVGRYGYRDSVDPATGQVSSVYLALDQGMSLVAIANHLNGGAIRRRVMEDPLMRGAPGLLREERFY